MTQTSILNQTSTDRRLVYGGITWQPFKLTLAGFAESPGKCTPPLMKMAS